MVVVTRTALLSPNGFRVAVAAETPFTPPERCRDRAIAGLRGSTNVRTNRPDMATVRGPTETSNPTGVGPESNRK